MAEILQVSTTIRCLYAPDSIPWAQILLGTNLERLQSRYKLPALIQAQAQSPAGASTVIQLVGSNGEFSIQDSLRPVQQLVISENMVQAQIAGETAIADALLSDVLQFFRELEPSQKSGVREYTRTYQTVAIAKLSVPFNAIFSENMLRYLRDKVPGRIKYRDAAPTIQLSHLSWQVKYKAETTDYSYLPKVLTIEPRQGTILSENLYFTQSPTDSETHKKLLEDFEAVLNDQPVESTAS